MTWLFHKRTLMCLYVFTAIWWTNALLDALGAG